MPSAKQILKQLSLEVDEAEAALVNEVLAAGTDDMWAELQTLVTDFRDKAARLDKAKGAS
jgi:hypothetical protein